MQFNFVTTFSNEYSQGFGIKMAESIKKYFPDNADLTVYYEGEALPPSNSKVKYLPFPIDKTNVFKKKFGHKQDHMVGKLHPEKDVLVYDRQKTFKFDAIRFAWKVYAMLEHHDKCNARYMGFIDADVELTKQIPSDFFNTLVKEGTYVSYLNRTKQHTETGFLIYDTHHPYHKTWWKGMKDLYQNGSLFELQYWTDSHAFDHLLRQAILAGVNVNPLVNPKIMDHGWGGSPLRFYSEHYKGPKKYTV
jgi:hypothetical protein